jgi:phosphate transport system substrate-binding protein
MSIFMLIGMPVIVDVSLILGLTAENALLPIAATVLAMFLPTPVILVFLWRYCAKRPSFPETVYSRLLPSFTAFFYYMTVWIAAFGLSGYRANPEVFNIFYTLSAPYFFVNVLLSFGGDFYLFPILQSVNLLANIIIYQSVCVFYKKGARAGKKLLTCASLAILLCAAAGYQFYDRGSNIVSGGMTAERVEGEIDMSLYRPFDGGNRLAVFPGVPKLAISENYPKIDGATAAYPVYAAVAQAIYKGLDENTAGEYVRCSKTADAYNRLIDGEIDIFFGAQPSEQQIEAARKRGVRFELTPIGREAFVFLVNRENPVSDLTVGQIQDIYQKKIRNWNRLGGRDEKITPFQRPDNSGSQTVMLSRVMSGKKLPPPMRKEYAGDMGGVVNRVAVYRNHSSAIGYSFRYFVEGMNRNDNVKLIAVDGAAPTVQNIKNGSYPFTVDFYAVTAGTRNENARKLIDWILSDQGRDFIELCGCVGL